MIGPARDEQGGIATVVNDYFKAGLESRCDVTYLACTCKGGKAGKLVQGLRSLMWLRCHAHDFDVLHVHMGGGNSFARERYFCMEGLRAGIPTVLHVHDGLFRQTFEGASDGLKKSYREVFSSVERVVALSESWKRYFEDQVTGSENVTVIPNGIRVPECVCMEKRPGTVLFLGHFDDNKNANVLIQAVAKARAIEPSIHAYFGADGDIERARRLVSDLNCESGCEILGWIGSRKKQELLDCCSIYCLPSKNEAFPMGLLEAMANGCAAVVTPVGGMRDIIEGGKTGQFVSVGDVDELAEAIVGLVCDENRRHEIAAQGRALVRERYALDAVVDAVIAMYEELVWNEH